MNGSVSILTDIPEALHESLQDYLETHTTWDQDRVIVAALSRFLLENEKTQLNPTSQTYITCARIFLETQYQESN
jgi:hypothetical protein